MAHTEMHSCMCTLIERNPPTWGGFLFTMFPHPEPCVRGFPSKDLYQVLRGGSSSTRFFMREHSKEETPPGGGISFDQYAHENDVHECACREVHECARACAWMRVSRSAWMCAFMCMNVRVAHRFCACRALSTVSYRSLLQNSVSFIGLFCKRDLYIVLHEFCACRALSTGRYQRRRPLELRAEKVVFKRVLFLWMCVLRTFYCQL